MGPQPQQASRKSKSCLYLQPLLSLFPLSSPQSGFHPCRSIKTALVKVTNGLHVAEASGQSESLF